MSKVLHIGEQLKQSRAPEAPIEQNGFEQNKVCISKFERLMKQFPNWPMALWINNAALMQFPYGLQNVSMFLLIANGDF